VLAALEISGQPHQKLSRTAPIRFSNSSVTAELPRCRGLQLFRAAHDLGRVFRQQRISDTPR
jgi:hypothetical protein